jgi:polar amino acid transport system permease protein
VFYFGFATWFNWQFSAMWVCVVVYLFYGVRQKWAIWFVQPLLQLISINAIRPMRSDLPMFKLDLCHFPQSLKRVTPGAINLFTRMVKTSSLAVLIGVVEVIKVGQQIIENSLLTVALLFGLYGFIFILYFLICYPLSRLAAHLEKVWSNYAFVIDTTITEIICTKSYFTGH